MTDIRLGAPAPGAAPGEDPPASRASTFRPEIQGLRALAVALVVLYHVWIGRVSGGVDVFLVLSGFLLVGGFVRNADRGVLDVVGYWRRTAGRIIPPAMVVLAGTVVASVVFLPEMRWPQAVREVVASALFVENWRLAADSVDYYAAKNSASVVQHFWSLSIQGQFYVVFPLVVALVVVVARRMGRGPRPALAVALVVLSVVSLAHSVISTADAQQFAYFDATTRLWEFTLGGLLAITVDRLRLPAPARRALGWLGVVALIACGLVLDVAGGFPGYLALWPVACAACVIVAGRPGGWGADRLLCSRPAIYLGDLAFSLYLWHWPVLVLTLVARGEQTTGWLDGLLVVVASLVLAVLTRRYVEVPLRRRRDRPVVPGRRRSLLPEHRLAGVSLVLVLVVAAGWQGLADARTEPPLVLGDLDHPGAESLVPGFVYRGRPGAPVAPDPITLSADWSQPIGPCVTGRTSAALEVCTAPTSGTPTRRVVVLGDSHTQQVIPALMPIAAQRGWEVTSMLKGACPFMLGPGVDPACTAWNTAAVDQILAIRPDVVVVQASENARPGDHEDTPPSFVAAWQVLAGHGIRVLATRDNPRYDTSPTLCRDGAYGPAATCDHAKADVYPATPSYATVPGVPPTTAFLDTGDLYCAGATCPPVIGNVLVYLDDNHISASYARTMAPEVARRMDALLDW